LQHVRRLGKRVAIASIKSSCAPDYADPRDEARVKDFDTIWLDDLLHRLVLKFERHQVECQSPIHNGDRRVWTTFRLRKGRKFYCDACRATFSAQRREAQQEYVGSDLEAVSPEEGNANSKIGMTLAGVINKKVEDRGFGFIHADDGYDYFFHFTDLEGELDFGTVKEGMRVDFDVKKDPSGEKGGAAQNVRPGGQ
jgi:CspA family cold shock protein